MEGQEGHMMTDHNMLNMAEHDLSGAQVLPDNDMSAGCLMSMLFNWQVKDVCIVFEFWHIHNILELVMSCLAIFLIAAGYEYIRVCFASCEQWSQAEKKKVAGQNALVGNGGNEEDCETANQGGSFLRKNMILARNRYSYREQALRSIIYAFLVAVSFWLMLVFMTYNGYLMIAVVLGAGIGHFLFGNGKSKATHDLQCH